MEPQCLSNRDVNRLKQQSVVARLFWVCLFGQQLKCSIFPFMYTVPYMHCTMIQITAVWRLRQKRDKQLARVRHVERSLWCFVFIFEAHLLCLGACNVSVELNPATTVIEWLYCVLERKPDLVLSYRQYSTKDNPMYMNLKTYCNLTVGRFN